MNEPLKLAIGYTIATLSTLGYGLMAARFTQSDENPPSNNLASDGVIGIAILTSLFMAAHFFVPLRQIANLLLLVPGVIAFPFFFKRRFLIELPILAVMIWWAFQLCRSYPAAYDQGLYHLQSTMWNTLEPAVAGIANVQTRLGFDSSVFVFAAGMNIPFFGGWHFALASPVLIEGMVVTALLLSIRSSAEKAARVYAFIAIVFLFCEPRWLLQLSYISPDPVVAIGIVYAVLLYLEKRRVAFLMWVPYLITVKLVAAPLLLLLDWKFLKELRFKSPPKQKVAAALGAAFLFVWVARNVVLSGHLLFPVAVTRLPVPWAVPTEMTVNTADWITSWARIPGKGLEETRGLGWVSDWAKRTYENDQVKMAAELFGVGVFFLVWKKAFRQVDWRLLSVIAVALMFWFISAPDPRFGIGFIYAAGFLILAYGLESIDLLGLQATNAWVVIAVLVVGLASAARSEKQLEWPKMMPLKLRLAFTPSGDRIWAPVPPEDRCFAVVPCAPEPEKIRYYPEPALQRAPTQ